jgi:hypothetical protein
MGAGGVDQLLPLLRRELDPRAVEDERHGRRVAWKAGHERIVAHVRVVTGIEQLAGTSFRARLSAGRFSRPFQTPEVHPVQTDTTFADAIQDHLALRERNSTLEDAMPITRYQPDDPFENHPLFKSEEQARLEETLEGVEAPPEAAPRSPLPWPGENGGETEGAALDESLWARSRDFDWGD